MKQNTIQESRDKQSRLKSNRFPEVGRALSAGVMRTGTCGSSLPVFEEIPAWSAQLIEKTLHQVVFLLHPITDSWNSGVSQNLSQALH